MLALMNFVAISLLVSLEMVKFWQGIFIEWDAMIFDEENGFVCVQKCVVGHYCTAFNDLINFFKVSRYCVSLPWTTPPHISLVTRSYANFT